MTGSRDEEAVLKFMRQELGGRLLNTTRRMLGLPPQPAALIKGGSVPFQTADNAGARLLSDEL